MVLTMNLIRVSQISDARAFEARLQRSTQIFGLPYRCFLLNFVQPSGKLRTLLDISNLTPWEVLQSPLILSWLKNVILSLYY